MNFNHTLHVPTLIATGPKNCVTFAIHSNFNVLRCTFTMISKSMSNRYIFIPHTTQTGKRFECVRICCAIKVNCCSTLI